MIKKLNFKRYNISFIFRHRFERLSRLDKLSLFTKWNIGVWFKKTKIVGTKNFNKPNEWNKHLVNDYLIGIEILFFKAWIEFNRGGMDVEI